MHWERLNRILLYAGFLYFAGVAVCHFAGWKIAGFFIYFDVPSNMYQDRIISVLAMGWSLFFVQAAGYPRGNRAIIKILIISGFVALAGLLVNTSLLHLDALKVAINMNPIYLQLAILFLYELALTIVFIKTRIYHFEKNV